MSAPNSSKRRVKVDDATMGSLESMMTLLGAGNWNDRYKGIEQLQQEIYENNAAVSAMIVKVKLKSSQKTFLLYFLEIRWIRCTPLVNKHMIKIVNKYMIKIVNKYMID